MIEAGATVRFACERCRQLFDVDLRAIELIRGRGYSLMNRRAQCKLASCRGTGRFVARQDDGERFLMLDDTIGIDATPGWVLRWQDRDDDPPPAAPALKRA